MRINPAITLLVLLIFGFGAFFFVTRSTKEIRGSSNNTPVEPSKNNKKEDKVTTKVVRNRDFDYQPKQPQNRTLKGVIEIGATGFNSFVINIDRDENWELIAKDFAHPCFKKGLQVPKICMKA